MLPFLTQVMEYAEHVQQQDFANHICASNELYQLKKYYVATTTFPLTLTQITRFEVFS